METEIIIVIEGGMLKFVSSNKDINYILIDLDNIKQGDKFPTKEDIYSQDYIFKDGLDIELEDLKNNI